MKCTLWFYNSRSDFCSNNASLTEKGSEAETRGGRWCPSSLAAAVHHWHVHGQASDQFVAAARAMPQTLCSDSQHAESNWDWAEAGRCRHPPVHRSCQEWNSRDVHGTVDAGSATRHEHLHLPSACVFPCPHVGGRIVWGREWRWWLSGTGLLRCWPDAS